ncbi:MAG: PorP/SprF family type IX secretion system membrane protein [Crocinitomicaceae bacterium]|nr:PorP/SprF family type IX secretion system membrane protein [Crocinitomicaceae bacterium]
MQLKKCLAGLLLLMVSFSTVAQQDKLITHFIYDKMSINPGKTGLGLYNTICATSIYRNQWDKVNGAPNSAVLNVEADLSRFFPGGIGLSLYHDAIGFAIQNNLAVNYSYPITIGNVGTLGLGVGVGLINYGLKPSWVPPTTAQDPDLPDEFAATNLDLNFGAYFNGKDFYVGISSTHLTESLLADQDANGFEQSYQTARHYYLMGGKKFANMFGGTIDAQVLMRTDLVKFSADFNARYIYDFGNSKIGYGGLTVRTSDAVALMFGYTPMSNLTVGYSYDITVNKLASISRGSHEIFFKYCYNLPEPPKQSARHPRWL